MPPVHFDCILGGVVTLDCEVPVLFGRVCLHGMRVSYHGLPFDCEGLVIDYDGEFLPMTEYLLQFAQQLYDKEKNVEQRI